MKGVGMSHEHGKPATLHSSPHEGDQGAGRGPVVPADGQAALRCPYAGAVLRQPVKLADMPFGAGSDRHHAVIRSRHSGRSASERGHRSRCGAPANASTSARGYPVVPDSRHLRAPGYPRMPQMRVVCAVRRACSVRCMSELEDLEHFVLDGVRGPARPVLDEAQRNVGRALLERRGERARPARPEHAGDGEIEVDL